ncbi:MAG: GGDEF domain-containing protein [Parvibaculum sp.]
MESVNQSLLEQMKFSHFEIDKRKALFDLDEDDVMALRDCRTAVAERLDWIITEFYARQLKSPEIALIIGDSDTLSRLKSTMRGYVTDLFDGVYGSDYVNARLRVGKVHWRIGVTPQYFLAALRILNDVLCAVIEEDTKEAIDIVRKRNALMKILFFDSHLVFDTYIFSLRSEVLSAQTETLRYADSLETAIKAIAEKTNQLQKMALTDELTGAYNKRAFEQHAQRELANAQRQKQSIGIIYVDVNDFKQLNDTLGHGAGDDLLRAMAANLTSSARMSDIICRLGGDEFCILMPNTDANAAAAVADRFALQMQNDPNITVGASLGIAITGPRDFLSVEAFIREADRSMYAAKEKKRNAKATSVCIDYGNKAGLTVDGTKVEAGTELDAFADEVKAELAGPRTQKKSA